MKTKRVLEIVILLPLVLLAIVSMSEARERHQFITAGESSGSEDTHCSKTHERAEDSSDTSNSNDFSYCCPEVSDPTHGIDPYYFHFDLSNARYWQHPIAVHILLHDTNSAIWSDVPQLDLQRSFTETTITFWGEGVSPMEDLTIPAQPGVFGITPRCWPSDEASQQEFTLRWISNGYYFTNTQTLKPTFVGRSLPT